MLTTVGPVSGRKVEIEVTIRELPLLSCGREGHPRRPATADFGLHAIDAVFWRGQVPLGRPGTLAKVKCYTCGKNLSKAPTRPGQVAGRLHIADLPEFGLWVKGPVTSCPRCQAEQLWASREIGRAVSSAMVAAFGAAGL
jgi:hypothetical protein